MGVSNAIWRERGSHSGDLRRRLAGGGFLLLLRPPGPGGRSHFEFEFVAAAFDLGGQRGSISRLLVFRINMIPQQMAGLLHFIVL